MVITQDLYSRVNQIDQSGFISGNDLMVEYCFHRIAQVYISILYK